MTSTHINSAQRKPTDASRTIVPYITAWTAEQDPPHELVERPGRGIAYRDESLADRDRQGVLWFRTPFLPGQGRPDFGRVHPLRQRRAMRRLLCQICAGQADHTPDGVLWLLRDHRDDWPCWPNGMGVTEPPICAECVHTSVRLCPALRRGYAVIRARKYPVSGVRGVLYQAGQPPTPTREDTFVFEDPAIHWVRAANLVRELNSCTIHPLINL